jgi:hypothetical protein
LCLIYFNKGEIKVNEAYKPLANFFNLLDTSRSISRGEYFSGDREELAWHCLVQWGKNNLKKSNDLESNSPRGVWKLTEEGVLRASNIKNRFSKLGSE